ncbi:protein arginine N-methyltransferase 7 [Phalaenopsis equestris]|uniref:protein arginine N-methyltransferase 7 n=1 Tax=Phalaenopsis equestris TaxID=78828 RepID=UPI0009E265C6|nr:protein arginine N-methyltransferase 7 [Phalaenopsis equestris]
MLIYPSVLTPPAYSRSTNRRHLVYFFRRKFSIFYRNHLTPSPIPLTRIMSSLDASRHRAFQLRQNPLTGESEWIVIDEEDEDSVDVTALSASRSVLAATSYLDMLNDSRRNRAFRLAIEKTITDPCHVLDIGAGTGLLSMMAARAMMGSPARGKAMVSACEYYLPMGKLMQKILRTNGMDRMVKLFHKRSDELQVGEDLDCRASVLVSEILDSELLGEGLISTLQHAHDMLLTTNAKTVPYRATTYGQLVESTFLWKLNDLHGNEVRASDGIYLSPAGLEKIVHVKLQQYAMHFNSLCNEIRLLSEPFKIFVFDFWRRPDSHGETEMWIKPTDDGKVHAVVTWWVLQLDREGSIFYSTAPNWIGSSKSEGVDYWCDHWRQCVWFIPGEGVSVSRDRNIFFKAVHNVTNVSYILSSDKKTARSSFHSHDSHLSLSPERIGIYGEKDLRSAFLIAVKNALQRVREAPLCVVADDSILLTVLAATLSETSKVISSLHGFQEKGYAYIQAVSVANGFSMDRIHVLNKRVSSRLLDDSLRKRNMKRRIKEEEMKGQATRGRGKGRGWGKWMKRRRSVKVRKFARMRELRLASELNDNVKGSEIGFLGSCGWLGQRALQHGLMEISEPGICHGLVLWIDWVLDEENSIVIHTGPVNRYWKQGVKLLSRPLDVEAGSSIEIEASFDASSGELTLEPYFPP